MGIPEIFNNKTYSSGDVNNRVIFFMRAIKKMIVIYRKTAAAEYKIKSIIPT